MKITVVVLLIAIFSYESAVGQVRYKRDSTFEFLDPAEREQVKGIITYAKSLPIDSFTATKDLIHHSMKLYCGLGFAVQAYTEGDKDFETKYSIHYQIIGCTVPQEISQLIAYNKAIADYLDKMYGRAWRTWARRDIVGVTR